MSFTENTRTRKDHPHDRTDHRRARAPCRGEHHDPHSVLGWHVDCGRPSSAPSGRPPPKMRVLFTGSSPAGDGTQSTRPGFFHADPADSPPFPSPTFCRLSTPTGRSSPSKIPTASTPTLGELDLYLIGEGRHHDLWKSLGAHPKMHQNVAGPHFSVWAPNARSVRVVGSFNFWDGRIHPMRSLGASGIWEIFLPAVRPGDLYKFEILTQAGHLPPRPTRWRSPPRSPRHRQRRHRV